MKKLVLILAMITLSIFSFAQNGKWKRTQKENSTKAYKEFLNKYPTSIYCDNAMLKLIELEFDSAENQNTIDGYKYFLMEYGENIFFEQATDKLIELEFKSAENQNTIDGYKYFLREYGENIYSEQAKDKLTDLEFENTLSKNTMEDYLSFQKNYPRSKYESEVQTHVFNLLYNNYSSATVITPNENLKNVKIKNLLIVRIGSTKTFYKEESPNIHYIGKMTVSRKSKAKTVIDMPYKAYHSIYYAINGKDIAEINGNSVKIIPEKYIFKIEVLDNDSKLLNSSALCNIISDVKSKDYCHLFNKEDREIAGAICFEEMTNGDFILSTIDRWSVLIGGALDIPDVYIMSIHDSNIVSGNILGQIIFDNDHFVFKPLIQFISNDKINEIQL